MLRLRSIHEGIESYFASDADAIRAGSIHEGIESYNTNVVNVADPAGEVSMKELRDNNHIPRHIPGLRSIHEGIESRSGQLARPYSDY